jgi:hypothetical protein
MSLKKLMSDLTNFKYDISSPDKVDSQIEKGVDFFDDTQGGAVGFTTEKENNLVSQYEKFTSGNVGKKWPEAAISYEKERKGFDEYDVPETYKQILVFPTDTFGTPWSDSSMSATGGHPPQFDSPFMVTPIADYVSKYSQPHAASLTLTVPLVKSSMNSGAINVGDIPEQTFDNSYGAFGAHGYPFMVTPINTFASRYPTDPSVTWRDEDGTMTGPVSKWPNPSTTISIVNNLGRFSQGQSYPYLISEGADLYDWGKGGYESKWPVAAPHPQGLEEDVSRFSQQSYPYLISEGAELHNWGSDFEDIFDHTAAGFANLLPITGRTSQFADSGNLYTLPEFWPSDKSQITLNIPKIKTSARVGNYGNADYTSAKNTGPFNENASSDKDLLDQLGMDKYTSKIDAKIAFSTVGSNTFTNVPAGLDENNFESAGDFRDVSDPYGAWGFRQPFILRPIPTEGEGIPGNGRWGFDPINSDTGVLGALAAGADSLLSGFVRGAPTFTGLVERNFTDKIRIGKFLLTPNGIGFIAKQYVLQALNPTIESKIYSPLSALGIPSGYFESTDEMDAGSMTTPNLARLLAGLALPIMHPERHIGGGRYEDVVPLTQIPDFMKSLLPASVAAIESKLPFGKAKLGFGSRIAMQSNPEVIPETTIGAFGYEYTIGGKDLGTSLIFMNPNRYLFPVSSAPKSIDKGIPSFVGGFESAGTDAGIIETKKGGTFNDSSAVESKYSEDTLIAKYSTLSYGTLGKGFGYITKNGKRIKSTSEVNRYAANKETAADKLLNDKRVAGKDIVDGTGQQGLLTVGKEVFDEKDGGVGLGLIKKEDGKYVTALTDKINMHPYGSKDLADDNQDFIKFRFYDVVNNKYIIFRAILSGISDSITPDYGEHQYLGRPDKLYTYKGADRKINFELKIYPKTKQELPVLMEKLNYLIGLCYPTYGGPNKNRMVTPFMELTMGDMFVDTPGLLKSLAITVENTSTWEMDEGLQFPKYISCVCSFQYIGKYPLHGKGKHYELGWLPGGTSSDIKAGVDLGYNDWPNRLDAQDATKNMVPLFSELGQPETR